MTVQAFNNVTFVIELWAFYISLVFTGLAALAGVVFVIMTDRVSNILLLTTCLVIFVSCFASAASFYTMYHEFELLGWLYMLASVAGNLAHGVICYTYLTATIELQALLDKSIYTQNVDRLAKVSRQKRVLNIASVISVVVIVANGLLCYRALRILFTNPSLFWTTSYINLGI